MCSRTAKFSGRNNPNVKYPLVTDSLYSANLSPESAYILGLIASDGTIGRNNSIRIGLQSSDEYLLESIADWLHIRKPIRRQHEHCEMSYITIHSKQICVDVMRLLGLTSAGKKDSLVQFPVSISKDLYNSFLLGYFDGDGSVGVREDQWNYPRASIASNSLSMLTSIKELFPSGRISTKHLADKADAYCIEFNGTNAIDMLGKLYTSKPIFYLTRKYDRYISLCSWAPGMIGGNTQKSHSEFRCVKVESAAVLPSKANASDSGYDLTLLREIKQEGDVVYYTTGVKLQPPHGWWLSLVPRSSMAKSGYMLANTIGIIDRSYQGPIIVALRKISPHAPDIALPAKLVQVIPIPAVHFDITEVSDFSETSERSEGGFGSSDAVK